MDFFARQAQAQRMTWFMLGQFGIAVLAIILAINAVAYLTFSSTQLSGQQQGFFVWLTHEGLLVSTATLTIIGAGSIRRGMQLSKGGSYLAVLAGALPLDPSDPDPLFRRFRNISEEMSIASGVPLPRLFIMPKEHSINAFVAGMRMEDTALVVTRGALDKLSRDELQGVIGHEYSHILQRDTQLNGRLIMVLGGIMLLSTLGRALIDSRRSGTRMSGSGKGDHSLALAGLVLYLIGYIGVFAGRLIQAAISRQREYHSDAAAVQFTRNPQGLAGALQQILTASERSFLKQSALAQEINHMCFSESLSLNRWMASHPPLDKRIAAIDPIFRTRTRIQINQARIVAQANTRPTPGPTSGLVGQWGAAQHNWAHATQQGLSTTYHLDTLSQTDTLALVTRILCPDDTHPIETRHKLPLLEILIPRLKRLEAADRAQVFEKIKSLPETKDGLARFCYTAYIEHHLLPQKHRSRTIHTYQGVRQELSLVLSLFVRLDKSTRGEKHVLFNDLARSWFPLEELTFQTRISSAALRTSLERLNCLHPLLKPTLIDAWSDAVARDGEVQLAEYELLRVAAELLDCPLPPKVD
ncbi:MAG: M48 family metalloprotease [Hahellaceae bacterium]|nr:M48 family metalloprotease [Hahellaceae bacterium]